MSLRRIDSDPTWNLKVHRSQSSSNENECDHIKDTDSLHDNDVVEFDIDINKDCYGKLTKQKRQKKGIGTAGTYHDKFCVSICSMMVMMMTMKMKRTWTKSSRNNVVLRVFLVSSLIRMMFIRSNLPSVDAYVQQQPQRLRQTFLHSPTYYHNHHRRLNTGDGMDRGCHRPGTSFRSSSSSSSSCLSLSVTNYPHVASHLHSSDRTGNARRSLSSSIPSINGPYQYQYQHPYKQKQQQRQLSRRGRMCDSNLASSQLFLTIPSRQSSLLSLSSTSLSTSPSASSSTRLSATPGKKSPETDSREWKAIIMALKLYKAAYGDLKVPYKFVVPSSAPWPESAWALKLGQKVSSIRESGLYVGTNEKRKAQLDNIGFVWRVRAPPSGDTSETVPFSQVYDALVAYREQIKPTGLLTIPIDFTVPDSSAWPENTRGLPLGRTLDKLKSKSFLKKNPEISQKLLEIGALESEDSSRNLSANDKRFQAIYDALVRYKEIYGDLMVPINFAIPDESKDFPESTWGIRLGARVNNIRVQGTYVKNSAEREEMLDKLGFVWTAPQKERKSPGRKSRAEIDREERIILEAKASKAMAASQAFDSDTATMDEDGEVESLLSSFDFSDSEEDPPSSKKGLTWGLEVRDTDDDDESAEANQDDDWKNEGNEVWEEPLNLDESLAAAKIRAIEAEIVLDNDTKRATKRKREHPMPWYNDDFGEDFVFEDVVEAFTLYKEFYGDFSNLTNNEEYVIPIKGESDPAFDEFEAIRNDFLTSSDGDDIKLSDFDTFQDPNSMSDEDIEAEINKMEDSIFELEPRNDPVSTLARPVEADWPEYLGGMRLGNLFRRIRDGSLEVKHLPERKAQLDAIGFDWGDPRYFLDVPFEKSVCAMYAYYVIRGDMFVTPDFVMPGDEPWPTVLAGFELGKIVRRIRELQYFFEEFHQEKMYVLRMFEFVWFPSLALPIDPDEGPKTALRSYLIASNHPDFRTRRIGPREPADPNRPDFLGGPPDQWWRIHYRYNDEVLEEEQGPFDDARRLRRIGEHSLAKEHEELYGPGLYDRIVAFTEELANCDIIRDVDEKERLAEVIKDYILQSFKCVDFSEDEGDLLIESLVEVRERHGIPERPMPEREIPSDDEEDESLDDNESTSKRRSKKDKKKDEAVSEFEEEELEEDVLAEDEDDDGDEDYDDEDDDEYEWVYDSEFEEELGLESEDDEVDDIVEEEEEEYEEDYE